MISPTIGRINSILSIGTGCETDTKILLKSTKLEEVRLPL